MNQTLIFHWRQADQMSKTGMWLMTAVLVAAIAPVLWLSPVAWASLDWHALWRKLIDAPGKRIELLLYCLAGMVTIVGSYLHQRRSRLTLDDRWLRFYSGLPWVGRWLDWNVDLDAIRSRQLEFHLAANPRAALALRFYTLSWKARSEARSIRLQQLRPAHWDLPDAPAARPAFLAFPVWNSKQGKAALQAKFEALPLVRALAQRGIVLPSISSQPARMGFDLMSQARMKAAVYCFFGLLILSVALLLATRNSYYFATPPLAVWLSVAGLAGLCTLGCLWGESAAEPVGQAGMRGPQSVLAALVGVAAGLCAPSLPLAYAALVQPAQEQVFALRHLPLELLPQHADSMPAVQQLKAVEYWQSLKEGDDVTLPVRRGAFGLWWQFDASALREKWIAYYSAHP